jgi:putative transposase
MPRPNRNAPGGMPFHVLNRAVGRRKVFDSSADFVAFVDAMGEALRTRPMRICSYCVMPNHYQGRFKSFPIQTEHYFLTVVRYVERNALRANLVARAEDWPWSSLGQRSSIDPVPLSTWPVSFSADRHSELWMDWVNRPQTEGELATVRLCSNRGRPFGDDEWVRQVAVRLDLGSTLQPRGRPRRIEANSPA